MPGEIRRMFFADGVNVTASSLDGATSKSINAVFDGTVTSLTVDVSSITSIAKSRIWVLRKPTGSDNEQIIAKITTPTDTSVFISTDEIALPAGTYTLLGV